MVWVACICWCSAPGVCGYVEGRLNKNKGRKRGAIFLVVLGFWPVLR